MGGLKAGLKWTIDPGAGSRGTACRAPTSAWTGGKAKPLPKKAKRTHTDMIRFISKLNGMVKVYNIYGILPVFEGLLRGFVGNDFYDGN